MLDRIIAASLNNRLLVLVLAFGVGAYGIFTAIERPIDVLPDLNRPVVTIMTEAHGMTPKDVERLVTWPIEQSVAGATGVFRVRSQSGTGLSVVQVDFDWDTDIYLARQIVSEKLQLTRNLLPDDVEPILAPISSIMGQIQVVGFRAEEGGPDSRELRLAIDRDVRPRILSLPGIAQVVTIGGQPSEVQVVIDPMALRAHDVTLAEVERATHAANVAGTGGTLHIGASGPTVTVPGLLDDAEELRKAVVKPARPRPILLEDLAEITFAPTAVPVGDAGVDGRPGVLMIIAKQPGVDTLDLTRRVEDTLVELERTLPDRVHVVPDVFRQADFIERAIGNVLSAVRDGGILVIVILFLFLLELRTTLITLTAIPLSVAVTAIVFAAFDLTINTMTLGGLAVAIGTLVDDAIVDVENVWKRLRENAGRSSPRRALGVVFEASREVRKPVTYGTLLVTIVYLPLFFLSGIEGRLFAPIGLAYVVSVGASLLVALTVTPVLCHVLLGKRAFASRSRTGLLIRGVHRAVEGSVHLATRRPTSVATILFLLCILAVLSLFTRGSAFLPEFNEGSYQVNLMLDPDVSLETSDAFGRRLETTLLQVPGVEHVGRRTGRAPGDEHAMPVSVSEAIVTIDPESERSREEILGDIRDHLNESFPGVATATEQPLKHLLDHMLSGVTATVAIKVVGPDLAVLRKAARKVESTLSSVPGVTDLFVEPQVLVDVVQVRPRRADLARHGFTVADVSEAIELAMGAEPGARIREGTISFPITVRYTAMARDDVEALEAIELRRYDGRRIALANLATVRLARSPSNINRENVERRIVVQHNVADRSLSEVVTEVESALEPVRADLAEKGPYTIRVEGQFEAQRDAERVILLLSALALVGMLVILFLHFGSLRISVLVLATRPVAFIGAAALVLATGQVVSIATLVGLIALLGVATRNAILLVDQYLERLRAGAPMDVELFRGAGRDRAVPILMTALTSGIGLLPLALSPGEPGREILYPVATVILGGLVTSTLLDFLLTPALFSTLGRRALQDAARPAEEGVEETSAR